MQATERYLARFKSIADEKRRTYAAMMSAMDDAIGGVSPSSATQGWRTTRWCFSSATTAGRRCGDDDQRSEQRSAARVQTSNLGRRHPCAIHHPMEGAAAGGKIDARLIIQLDVLPTALAAAGVTAKPKWKLDGVNLLPYLTGKTRASAPCAVLAAVRPHGDSERPVETGEDDGGTAVGQRHDPAGICRAPSYSISPMTSASRRISRPRVPRR